MHVHQLPTEIYCPDYIAICTRIGTTNDWTARECDGYRLQSNFQPTFLVRILVQILVQSAQESAQESDGLR